MEAQLGDMPQQQALRPVSSHGLEREKSPSVNFLGKDSVLGDNKSACSNPLQQLEEDFLQR